MLKLSSVVPVGGAEGGSEADEGDGEEGQDDGGETDVGRCAHKGERKLRGIFHEVLAIHGQRELGSLSVERVGGVVSWRCGTLDSGRIHEDCVGLAEAAESAAHRRKASWLDRWPIRVSCLLSRCSRWCNWQWVEEF